MSANNRFSRRPLPLIQMLDARRLFAAFATTDYMPLGPGNTWNYNYTKDGINGVMYRTSSVKAGQTTLTDTVYPGDGSGFTQNAKYSYSALTGLSEGAGVEVKGDITVALAPKTPIIELPPTFEVGSVTSWTSVPLSVSVTNSQDVVKGTGTESGSQTVLQAAPFTILDGFVFPQAVEIRETEIDKISLKEDTGTVTLEDNATDTKWYVKGLGLVQSIDIAKDTVIATDGTATNSSHKTSIQLADSSLALVHVAYDGSSVILSGTKGNDDLEIHHVGKQFIVTCNGNEEAFASKDVSSVAIYGEGGNDRITVDDDIPLEVATGGSGDDYIVGSAGANRLDGGGGDDRIIGMGGRDSIDGDSGNDSLYGDAGNDRLDGGSGIDHLYGGSGNDTLTGDGSNDKLYAESGNDSLNGGSGADLIDGGSGNDSATVETGIDSVADVEQIVS